MVVDTLENAQTAAPSIPTCRGVSPSIYDARVVLSSFQKRERQENATTRRVRKEEDASSSTPVPASSTVEGRAPASPVRRPAMSTSGASLSQLGRFQPDSDKSVLKSRTPCESFEAFEIVQSLVHYVYDTLSKHQNVD